MAIRTNVLFFETPCLFRSNCIVYLTFLEDRKIIRKCPTNLSMGIATLFVNLIEDIVGENENAFESMVESYIKSEFLGAEGTDVKNKLFIFFPESEEMRCTTQFLRSIEKHQEESLTVTLRPLTGQRRQCRMTSKYISSIQIATLNP